MICVIYLVILMLKILRGQFLSQHKVQFWVSETIPYIYRSKIFSGLFVVCKRAWPQLVPKQSNSPRWIFLDWPAANWLIICEIIQEVSLVNCVILLQALFLIFLLNISEMGVRWNDECFFNRQTSKCFILVYLVVHGQFECALWYNVRVIFNGSH